MSRINAIVAKQCLSSHCV